MSQVIVKVHEYDITGWIDQASAANTPKLWNSPLGMLSYLHFSTGLFFNLFLIRF